jgi:tetratricopeptide (TPR) repeat protein
MALLSVVAGLAWLLNRLPLPSFGGVEFALSTLVLLTAAQCIPLPASWLERISPGTVALRRELWPVDREVFRGDVEPLAPAPSSWQPISLYPTATQENLIHLLALLAVFIVARSVANSSRSFRRLAWVALLTGASLSLFAIVQRQSSPPNQIYWRFTVSSQVFGPFVNRNHFPDYTCLCLGAALVLLARPAVSTGGSDKFRWGMPPPIWADSRFLWSAFLSSLIVVASFFSMSRGGILAILGATSISLVLVVVTRPYGLHRFKTLCVVLLLVMVLALLLGTIPVESRLASAWRSDDWRRRVAIWSDTYPHLVRFLGFGSGAGTFEFVEPMYSTHPPSGAAAISEHAHNEYLEAAFEGGLPRLIVVFLLAASPTILAYRRLKKPSMKVDKNLAAIGLSWGLNVVVLHSVVEFGIHLPATACAAAIVGGYLAAISTSRRDEPAGADTKSSERWNRWMTVLACLSIAPIFVLEALTSSLADRYAQAARRWAQTEGPTAAERALQYWEAATQLRPQDAVLHQEAGQAYLNLCTLVDAATQAQRLREGLRHLVVSRDLCPFLAHPHVRLGEWHSELAVADPADRYFERAVKVLPDDHELWYAVGRAYLDSGRHSEAQRAWQTYLSRDRKRLPQIAVLARKAWGEEVIRSSVLPPIPSLYVAVAKHLHPEPSDREGRQPYLIQAEALLLCRQDLSAAEWYELGGIQAELGHIEGAIAAYRQAVTLAPDRKSYYIVLVKLLRQQSRWHEAREVLRQWQSCFPNDPQVESLVRMVERELLLSEP